jgi:hypothetical protein
MTYNYDVIIISSSTFLILWIMAIQFDRFDNNESIVIRGMNRYVTTLCMNTSSIAVVVVSIIANKFQSLQLLEIIL